MARLFDDGSSQYLRNTNAVVSSLPLTLAAWFNTDSLAITEVILSIADGGATADYAELAVSSILGDVLYGTIQINAGSVARAESSISVSQDTWQHGVATYRRVSGDNVATVYLNGGNSGTDTAVSVDAPDSWSRTTIGAQADQNAGNYWSGRIGEAGVWNVELTTGEIVLLSLGCSPLLVRPQNLIAYWPLIGRTSPEVDLVGGYDLTLMAGPTTAAHPPQLYYPVPGISFAQEALTYPLVQIQGNSGLMTTASTVGSTARAIASATPTSDVEEVHKFRFNETDPVATFRTFIRTSSDWDSAHTPTKAYELSVSSSGGYQINRIESGVRTLIGTGPWVADTGWWWIKFQAVSTNIRYKMWPDGQGEPVAWMNDIDDSVSGFTTAGRMQLALRTGA